MIAMLGEPPPSEGFRFAVYAAALTLVGLFAFQVLSAPKTPYQELRARVDTGWKGTYFDESVPLDVRSASDSECRIRGGSGWYPELWKPFNVLTTTLLAFLALGLVGWLETAFARRRPGPHRRPHRIDSAPA